MNIVHALKFCFRDGPVVCGLHCRVLRLLAMYVICVLLYNQNQMHLFGLYVCQPFNHA